VHALVALIGVQSNQYPRALDIARPFRQVGIPDARTYTDLALTPVRDDDVRLDLLTKTAGARAAVAHVNKVNELIGATRPHSTAE
jgi:hypothetical protein